MANGYTRVWKDAILATELYGEFNAAGTPWSMLARMGGSRRMRGYYEGQYNDNCMITFQAELRQRIWRRIGAVAWGGAGNVFHCFKRFPVEPDAAQLWHRIALGVQKTGQHPHRLRIRPTYERIFVQHQRSVLTRRPMGNRQIKGSVKRHSILLAIYFVILLIIPNLVLIYTEPLSIWSAEASLFLPLGILSDVERRVETLRSDDLGRFPDHYSLRLPDHSALSVRKFGDSHRHVHQRADNQPG